jgi:hypothetical protein
MNNLIDNENDVYVRSQRATRTQLYKEYMDDTNAHLNNVSFKEWLNFMGWGVV